MSGESEDGPQTRSSAFRVAEYRALANYFGTVVTFRFTTASFFIAAVALVLGIDDPKPSHHLLLLAVSLGIWIVELRHRSILDNLMHRARRIEREWAPDGKDLHDDFPLFTHMSPSDRGFPGAVKPLDRTWILWFRPFHNPHLSHTIGLDVVYLSVIGYSGISLIPWKSTMDYEILDPVASLLTVALAAIGANLIKTYCHAGQGTNERFEVIPPTSRRSLLWAGIAAFVGAAFVLVFTVLRGCPIC